MRHLCQCGFRRYRRSAQPAGYADYNILFAKGGMVLAYTTSGTKAATIAAPNTAFDPPASIPKVAADWYAQLTEIGVATGGSNPFLDPSGYRSDLIFQLAENHYGVPNLYNSLLTHYSINKSTDILGKTYDYQFTYEHSALAAYKANATGTYRYAKLPDAVNLGDPDKTVATGKRVSSYPDSIFPTPRRQWKSLRREWCGD